MRTANSSWIPLTWKCERCNYTSNTRDTCTICRTPRFSTRATAQDAASSSPVADFPHRSSRLSSLLYPATRCSSPGAPQVERCSCCFTRGKLSPLAGCTCKVCDKCLEPVFRLRWHAPFITRLSLYCPGCHADIADSDLLALLGEEGYREAQGNVFDALERHVVELGSRSSYSSDDNVRKGVKMCRGLLMIENALHNERLHSMVEQGMQDMHQEFSHVRRARELRTSKGSSVMEFITSALVFRGGLNKLLRVWLVRAHCIIQRQMPVDYIDERLLQLVTEISSSRALLPCLIEPVSVSYSPPVNQTNKAALAELLKEPQSVFNDLKALKKLSYGRQGHSSLYPAGSNLKWYCEQLADTLECVKAAVRLSGLDVYSGVRKESQVGPYGTSTAFSGVGKEPPKSQAWTEASTMAPTSDADLSRGSFRVASNRVSQDAQVTSDRLSSPEASYLKSAGSQSKSGAGERFPGDYAYERAQRLSPSFKHESDSGMTNIKGVVVQDLDFKKELTSPPGEFALSKDDSRYECGAGETPKYSKRAETKSTSFEYGPDTYSSRMGHADAELCRDPKSYREELDASFEPQPDAGSGHVESSIRNTPPNSQARAETSIPRHGRDHSSTDNHMTLASSARSELSSDRHSSALARMDSEDVGETDYLFQQMLMEQLSPASDACEDVPKPWNANSSLPSQSRTTDPPTRCLSFTGSRENSFDSTGGAKRTDSIQSTERAMLDEVKRISMLNKEAEGSPRPDYQMSRLWSNDSLDGTSEAIELVGKRLPLEKSFDRVGAELKRRLRDIQPRYPHWRSIYGDGNCFYRAFLFTLLEGLLDNRQQAAAVQRRTERLKSKLASTSFQEGNWEGGAFLLDGMLFNASEGKLTLSGLEDAMNDRDIANPMIQFLRRLTSWEMLRHPRRYQDFVIHEDHGSSCSTHVEGHKRKSATDDEGEDYLTAARLRELESHCRKHVDKMGEEAEEWHMVALGRVMRVPIEVESIGNGDASYHRKMWEEDDKYNSPLSQLPASNRKACLLYLPGHYEIIYPAEAC